MLTDVGHFVDIFSVTWLQETGASGWDLGEFASFIMETRY